MLLHACLMENVELTLSIHTLYAHGAHNLLMNLGPPIVRLTPPIFPWSTLQEALLSIETHF